MRFRSSGFRAVCRGVVAALVVAAGFNGWNYWQRRQAAEASGLYEQVQKAAAANDKATIARAAADMEDHNDKHIVTPGRVIPARELLGEMLLELKQPDAALKEFEMSQAREPNRFRNYLGSAKAAEMAGDKAKAAGYYQKLVALAKDADTDRPELAAARKVASR